MLACHVCGARILRLGDPCPDWRSHQLVPHADVERYLAETSAPSEQDREDALLAAVGLDASPEVDALDQLDLDLTTPAPRRSQTCLPDVHVEPEPETLT